MTPPAYARANQARFSIIFEQAIYLFNKCIGVVQHNLLTDIFDFVNLRFA